MENEKSLQVVSLKKEQDAVPGADELKYLSGQITELQNSKSKLGLFKKKEKMAIQGQIDSLTETLTAKTAQRKAQCDKIQDRIDDIIEECANKINPLKERIAEINEEFAKDR